MSLIGFVLPPTPAALPDSLAALVDMPARRSLLIRALAAGAVAAAGIASQATSANDAQQAGEVVVELFAPSGKSTGVFPVARVVKSDAEWRRQLSRIAYDVTRRAGTEVPYSGQYADNHADGLYRCIGCDTALYDSRSKFESGTGWPSFWQPISSHNVVQAADHSLGMERDAIACRRCDAHLGHVFDDGPKPTGLRYCMNSVALNFVARA
jgi:peptide-methionine (R)-S-oxide reductase